MDSIKIGQYLSVLRRHYKITQDELALKLNVTRQAVSKWESGAALPGIEMLMSLSEIYGVSINEILKADVTDIKFQKEIVFPSEERPAKKVFVIGCGRWGTFIAWPLSQSSPSTTLYSIPS